MEVKICSIPTLAVTLKVVISKVIVVTKYGAIEQ